MQSNQDQINRFKEAARHLECDDQEEAFSAKLKKVAKAKALAPAPEPTKD